MKLTITPTRLTGGVTPPPSKSIAHRVILAAALADGESVIENAALSEDILATLHCSEVLGAKWSMTGSTLRVTGNGSRAPSREELPRFDCGESGSTLRFLIPIALALTGGGIFTGRGRLMERPMEPYREIFKEKGILFQKNDDTLTVQGALPGGEYRLAGNISSQFFTGLLFALPLAQEPSVIIPTTPVESAAYIAMTVDTLRRFGVSVATTFSLPPCYAVRGGARYLSRTAAVESDWSQAAFWYAAKELGSPITIRGMAEDSLQGDSVFPQWMALIRQGGEQVIDASQNPDLVPPLAARGAVMNGTLRVTNIARLRAKESDRIAAIHDTLAALGADVTAGPDSLTIIGRENLPGGVTVDSHGDHRIAMMLAIAALRCKAPVSLTGAECVAKSYPDFWEDYKTLGGIIHEHTGE